MSVYEVTPDSNLTDGDFEDLNGLQGALAGYKQMGNGRGSFNLYYRYTDANRFNANQPADPDTQNEATNSVFGGTIDYRFAIPVGQNAVGLRVGIDGSTASSKVRLYADSTKFGGGSVLTTDVQSPLSDIAGFALADYTVGRVTLSGGLRYDYVHIPFHNLIDSERDTTSNYSRLDPRVGVDVNAGKGFSLFASFGTSFRAPSLIEVACADPEEPCVLPYALGDDPPIAPVTVTTFEGGARYNSGALSLTGTAYYSDVKNDIYLFPSENEIEGSTIEGYFSNIPKTRRVGIELAGRYAFGEAHSVYANYAYTRATFQSEARDLLGAGGHRHRERDRAGRPDPAGAAAAVQGGREPALRLRAAGRRRRALDRRAGVPAGRGQQHAEAAVLLRGRPARRVGVRPVGDLRRREQPVQHHLRDVRYLQLQPGCSRLAAGTVRHPWLCHPVPGHRYTGVRAPIGTDRVERL